jgi:hypothetical protein
MNLTLLIDMFRNVLAKREIEPIGKKNTIDLTNNQMICTGDICVCSWKPCESANYLDPAERIRQNN